MNRRPRVLIADDQILVAECMQRLLENDFPNPEIATHGQALLDAAVISQPDLVLLEITMPPLNGFELMRRLREVSPTTKVIIVTMRDEPECVRQAIRAGASGYMLKCCAGSELFSAIRRVLDGHSYVTPLVSHQVASRTTNLDPQRSRTGLTLRQREVLQLVAQGHTAKEIAKTLSVSVKTAVFHKVAIMDKLGLRTTAELTRYAVEHGVLSPAGSAEKPPIPILQPDAAPAW